MLAQRIGSVLPLAVLLATAVSGCDDPCLALTRDLCMCERTEYDQQACVQRVEAVSLPAPTADQEDCCILLQDSCTCEKLAEGNLAACGIAQEEDAEALKRRECVIAESLEPVDPG